MLIYVLSVALGIGLLTLGGEALIKGALGAAERLGISALLAGLVIVGFGTSAPELVVSIDAAINQQPDIAVGNVIGSNIGNLLLILGLCALITPLAAKPEALRRDGLMMLLATLLVVVLAWGSALNRLDAFILLAALISYLIWAYRTERQGELASAQLHAAEASEVTRKPQRTLYIVLFIVAGLACLIIGSQVLLSGAVGIAQHFGVSEALIGLSLVAVGTSLPELSISVLAALRRHADVAIGNILGSNIFNILGILGISALLQPLPMAARIISFDQWVMLGVTLVALLFLLTGKRLSRLEGAALLAGYIVYMWLSFTVV
ncbi:calcium/sodium antiporter [Aliidiomarina maris]|uniref:Cation:H+ antiporter n=1 Tax=Aliidiomarina maris TaxID=531312 RepID=A0A327X4F3_9GAMM|nr:calcium/sodium antiporter [Aliidiomarina maris]RAK00579.1 cation:H+ antiporter [Aliidiomarina maris]